MPGVALAFIRAEGTRPSSSKKALLRLRLLLDSRSCGLYQQYRRWADYPALLLSACGHEVDGITWTNGQSRVARVAAVFIRFQSKHPRPSGRYPGIFALANGLAHDGRLSLEERAWWRANNDWYDAAYPSPEKVDPSIFDKTRHPHTTCWFKESATPLLSRVPGYLQLLDAHGVEWVELRSTDPGIVLYEDDVQVVVAPSRASSPSPSVNAPTSPVRDTSKG